jgi:hypothetical protein
MIGGSQTGEMLRSTPRNQRATDYHDFGPKLLQIAARIREIDTDHYVKILGSFWTSAPKDEFGIAKRQRYS